MHLAKVIALLLAILESCSGLYIKKAERESPVGTELKKDDWGVFKNTLGLTQQKGV